MNIWVKSMMAGLVTAIAFYFIAPGIGGRSGRKLFDIRYSVKVAANDETKTGTEDVISAAIPVLKNRLTEAGTVVAIRRLHDNLLDIVLKDADDTVLAKQAITANSKLEIREVYQLSELTQAFHPYLKSRENSYKMIQRRPNRRSGFFRVKNLLPSCFPFL